MTTAPTVEFDHHSETYAQNWRDIYRDLRQKCPVAHTEAHDGYYVISRFEDVERAVRDDDTFASRYIPGTELRGVMIPQAPLVSIPIEVDPPEQTPLRKLWLPFFSLNTGKKWEPFVRAVTTAMLDAVIETGRIEMVEDLGSPVPALLTSSLLGLPPDDWRFYSEISHRMNYTSPTDPDFGEVVAQHAAMLDKCHETEIERRATPTDDLMSAFVTWVDANGNALSGDTVRSMCAVIIGAGNDTTTALFGNAFVYLSEHPEAKVWLADDPSRITNACEEFLRFYSPVQGFGRTVTKPVEIAGYSLDRGDRVWISFAAANHDPTVFERPEEIILDRFPNRHQAFGLGLHRCLGHHYTRMVFRVVMEEVLRRIPDFKVDLAASTPYKSIGNVNGWKDVHARFTPGKKQGSTFDLDVAGFEA